jgi:hypothetical protein
MPILETLRFMRDKIITIFGVENCNAKTIQPWFGRTFASSYFRGVSFFKTPIKALRSGVHIVRLAKSIISAVFAGSDLVFTSSPYALLAGVSGPITGYRGI